MAKESDQTRWVGIRPTDPSENIPVTESAPLTSIKVEPKEAATEFKTLTKKRSPAISDLQAISDKWQWYETYVTPAAGNYNRDTPVVPAGKIGVGNYALSCNSTAVATLNHMIVENGTLKAHVNGIVTGFSWQMLISSGIIIVDEGQFVRFAHDGVANGATCVSSLAGYLIDKY